MSSRLLSLIIDCQRFVVGFFDVIEESAMHIYDSALPWSPTTSITRQLYLGLTTTQVKLVNAIHTYWETYPRTIPTHRDISTIAFSHNGSALAVVSDVDVKIFEIASGVATFEVDEPAVSISFSPDDVMLVCGYEDGSVKIWNVQTSNLVQLFNGHVKPVRSVMFSPCGTMILSGGDNTMVQIWDISPGRCNCVLDGHSDQVLAVCWSGIGDRVISGSLDCSVMVWDVSSSTCLMILYGHTKGVTSVACSCDSSLIASGSKDGTVQVHDARSGDCLQSISTNNSISSVQFSTYGDKLLYTNWDTAKIWDLSRNMQLSTIDCDGFDSIFSPDGTRLASRDDSSVKIRNVENGDSDSEKDTDRCPAKVLTFAPDGSMMASQSSYDIKIWDTTSGDCLFTINSHPHLQLIVFSPNSAFVARWSDDLYAQVWSTHTRGLVQATRLDFGRFSNNVALSPCGGRLVSLSSSQIILWDLGSGEHLARLNFDPSLWRGSRISFAIDGTSVFIHTGDSIQQRWYISPAVEHGDHFPNSNQSTSLPLVFMPVQEGLSLQLVVFPIQCCRYEGDEWILDENGRRILWLPPDRRGEGRASKSHGKNIAVGTDCGVYLADFSNVLL
jgi:WD40 repeat protein